MSAWHKVCAVSDIPQLGSRVLAREGQEDIAIFRNNEDEVFALEDRCPHKGGPLSQGIVFGRKVTCPLHGLNMCLENGQAVAPDEGCTRTYPIRIEEDEVFIELP